MADQFPDLDRLSDLLRESVSQFMDHLNIEERTSSKHEEQVHFEEWVRYLLGTSLIPDVLAVACGVFEYDARVLNDRMPALLDRWVMTIPVDAEFISDVMARLPDHQRMKHVGYSLGDEARHVFNAALYQVLDIEVSPE